MSIAAAAATPVDGVASCRHCGESCDRHAVATTQGSFCCQGCEAVYAALHARALDAFYVCDVPPGRSQQYQWSLDPARFAVLDDPDVAARVVDFDDGRAAVATFSLPSIHCASCVWLLEQFWRFDPGATRTEVDLARRTVRVEYRPADTSPRRIAEQLAALGYEPDLSVEQATGAARRSRRRLYLQIGVAGFAFGNIMLFSVPRYANGAPLDAGFQTLFNLLNLALAIPVLGFSAQDYFRTAWHALRRRAMALEVPVALGLVVLFARSAVDIAAGRGEGFLDSFAGLVFFLLLGRLFQQRAFDRIAFDRTFRSFLPLSVRVEDGGVVRTVPIARVRAGDVVAMRGHEVVPADARLLDADAVVDYSFITGEQTPTLVRAGGVVRAGGRAVSAMRVRLLGEVSHSRLASLWNHPIFGRPKPRWLTDVSSAFGGWFTAGAVGLAAAGAYAWWPDVAASASVATAVLIVACPCALTLSAPITLGTAMGELGRRGLYLKQPAVVLDLSRIDLIVFDKTGTLTGGARTIIERHGLSARGWANVQRLARQSTHPISRAIAETRDLGGSPLDVTVGPLADITEVPGQGVSATMDGVRVAIGSRAFVGGVPAGGEGADDRTYAAAGQERGWVRLSTPARPGIDEAAARLAAAHDICLLSGDQGAEWPRWSRLFGHRMRFLQTPDDKLAFVGDAQSRGRRVLMVGDGLNDAGALAAADVGLAVSDETACVVPACDGVVSGDRLADLPAVLAYARRARQVVVACLVVSVAYNAVGLALALAGALTPLASAILMPVSSLTVVGLSSGAMRWTARRLRPA